MNLPQVYTCSPSWTPFLLPPCTVPLGHPSAWAPSTLYPALNLDWRFVSHMILYMFQCHSPKSSHPLSLQQSKRLFYTSVSLLFSCIQGYRYHLSKFHIYALYTVLVFFSLAYFTLYNRLQFHPPPGGVVWGGGREGGSGWGTRVYLWWIHVDVWQNQYNIVK